MKEIIWERWNFATVNNEVIHLMASEASDCCSQNIRVLNIATVGDHLNALFARQTAILVQTGRQISGKSPTACRALRASVDSFMSPGSVVATCVP